MSRRYDRVSGCFLTQDPIGLAGGVNLYAYAGNNPISYDDPFGLFDVEYTDKQTQQDVEAMRKKSKTFDKSIHNLENNHHVLVKIGRGSTAPCGGGGGCSQQEGKNKKGQDVYQVTIDAPGGVASENALLQATANTVATVQTTIGHEVYGHVVPWTQGWDCADGFPGTPAAQSCAVTRENVIRRELHIPIRTQY